METESEEALHHHRSCSVVTDCLAAVAAIHVGLGGNGERTEYSRVGERYRLCSCGRSRGDAMGGSAQMSDRPNPAVESDAFRSARCASHNAPHRER